MVIFMEKVHIAICDSDLDSIVFYEECCRDFGDKYGFDMAIETYKDSALLLRDMKDPEMCDILDILLIEIYLDSTTGIEAAKKIRDAGFKGAIIFVSNPKSSQYYEDIFDVMAFNFVRKQSGNINRFEDVLHKAIKAIGKIKSEYLMLNFAGARRKVDISTIRYFEIQGNHLIRVYYDDTDFAFYSTMGKLENQLAGRQFCRIHKSFMISLNYLKHLDGYEAVMKDGLRIPIGRSYKDRLVALWEEW